MTKASKPKVEEHGFYYASLSKEKQRMVDKMVALLKGVSVSDAQDILMRVKDEVLIKSRIGV